MSHPNLINLANLARGAVAELFAEELTKVGENILDVNTEPKGTRKITVTLEFKPEEDRREVTVHAAVKSSLVPLRKAKTRLYIGMAGQHLRVEEEDHRQGDLFKPPAPAVPDVAAADGAPEVSRS